MAAKQNHRCVCGKARSKNRCQAAKALDTARQVCQKLGQPPATWPVKTYRCRIAGNCWHLTGDRENRENHLRQNLGRLQQLLDQRERPFDVA
jgi:hypothetical protein